MITNFIYVASCMIFCIGLYIIMSASHYFRKLIGLGLLQNSVLIFYISFGKRENSIVPLSVANDDVIYTSPLPHVLMLTAIVVGFTTIAVGIALIYRIQAEYNSCNELEIKQLTQSSDD